MTRRGSYCQQLDITDKETEAPISGFEPLQFDIKSLHSVTLVSSLRWGFLGLSFSTLDSNDTVSLTEVCNIRLPGIWADLGPDKCHHAEACVPCGPGKGKNRVKTRRFATITQ